MKGVPVVGVCVWRWFVLTYKEFPFEKESNSAPETRLRPKLDQIDLWCLSRVQMFLHGTKDQKRCMLQNVKPVSVTSRGCGRVKHLAHPYHILKKPNRRSFGASQVHPNFFHVRAYRTAAHPLHIPTGKHICCKHANRAPWKMVFRYNCTDQGIRSVYGNMTMVVLTR